jgi:hypothetical protein
MALCIRHINCLLKLLKEAGIMDIKEIAEKLNELAKDHPIGRLQELRTQIRGKASRTYAIFTASTIFPQYAFHDGGRHELQFNIAFEKMDGRDVFRYGVAFSLKPSFSLPNVSVLFPKIDRFNYYLRTNPCAFPGLFMWYWIEADRSLDFYPRPIEPAITKANTFIFLGKWVEADDVNIQDILDEFNGLLPLYGFVESGDFLQMPSKNTTVFRPGCSVKKLSAKASQSAGECDIALRHNALQCALFDALAGEYGPNQVATEFAIDAGGFVDAVVAKNSSYIFFEIKVAPSTRSALREALGQILEYAYWPNANRANILVVVGEESPTKEAESYLKNLRKRFGLKLFYRQIDMTKGTLSPAI